MRCPPDGPFGAPQTVPPVPPARWRCSAAHPLSIPRALAPLPPTQKPPTLTGPDALRRSAPRSVTHTTPGVEVQIPPAQSVYDRGSACTQATHPPAPALQCGFPLKLSLSLGAWPRPPDRPPFPTSCLSPASCHVANAGPG